MIQSSERRHAVGSHGRAAPPARRQDAVLRREVERREEQQRLQRDDHAAGRAVQEVADIGADEAGRRAQRDADDDQTAEAVGQQVGGRARRHHHGDHQAGADGLQRRHRAGAQQREEQALQAATVLSPSAARMALVEEGDHQVLPLERQDRERDGGDDRDLHDVLVGDRQDVAEHDASGR